MATFLVTLSVVVGTLIALALMIFASIWLRSRAREHRYNEEVALSGRIQIMQRQKTRRARRPKQRFTLAHH